MPRDERLGTKPVDHKISTRVMRLKDLVACGTRQGRQLGDVTSRNRRHPLALCARLDLEPPADAMAQHFGFAGHEPAIDPRTLPRI